VTLRDIFLALVPPVCWGVGFTVAKPAVAQFPPLFMMAVVCGAVAPVLVFIVREELEFPLIGPCALPASSYQALSSG